MGNKIVPWTDGHCWRESVNMSNVGNEATARHLDETAVNGSGTPVMLQADSEVMYIRVRQKYPILWVERTGFVR